MTRFGRAVWFGLLLLALILVPLSGSAQESGDEAPVLRVFVGEGCPYCAAQLQWLPQLTADFPDLEVEAYEVYNNMANRQLLIDEAERLGFEVRGVPVTVFGDEHWIGFSEPISVEIRAAVEAAFAPDPAPNPGPQPNPGPEPAEGSVISVPLLGDVDVGSMSLLGASAVIGFVDGFNPCSLWVLTILLALVLHTGSRRRVLAVGGVFLAVTTAMYGLYMVGAYSALSLVSHLTWVRVLLAAIALSFGIINVKDYFWFRQGPSLEISESAKPGIYSRMRSVAAADKPLPAVLGGTAALAVGVSLLETPCTAGLPVLWINLLNEQQVAFAAAAVLFGVYMAVFLIDELVVFGAAVATMKVSKVEEKQGRVLKLVSGWVMIVLAGTLIFYPRAMESVTGAVAVFLLAAALSVVSALVDRVRRPPDARLRERSEPARTR